MPAAAPPQPGGAPRQSPQTPRTLPQQAARRAPQKRYARRGIRFEVKAGAIIGAAILVLGIVFVLDRQGGASGGAGQYAFQVGSPGPGEQAPTFRLASTAGGTFDLAAQRGKSVLLYFQEGLTCEPCWTQIKDIEAHTGDFTGITLVSLTTDPLDALKQKVTDEGLATPVLSDPNLAVSQAYHANSYGMMGASRDGHTFILIGPDGRIQWRADYGGAPDYTMYVPVPNLVADLKKGLVGSGGGSSGR